MEISFALLCQSPLFQGVTPQELGQMLPCLGAQQRRASRGQLLFHAGQPARWVGLVLEGAVHIVQEDYYGSRSIVATIQPPELFGEAFACAGVQVLPVSAEAAQDCRVLLLDVQRVIATCSDACAFHQRLVGNLLGIVARKNLTLTKKLALVSKKTTREKLMAYLLAQAKKHGSNEFTIPYDRQSLADYLEVDRSAMSAEISRLRREGILETDRSWFRLLDARL